jgi:iron complex outermembrane receptor protein
VSMFRGPLRVGVAAFALAFGTPSAVGQARAQTNLAFPFASLSDSLNALSRAAGVEILADPALLRGKRAPAVKGAPTPEAALIQLLRGSGLTYEKRGRTFLIVRGARTGQSGGAGTASARAVAGPPSRRRVVIPTAGEMDAVSDIVVTGTHIVRPELDSAMPTSVVTMEDARNFGRTGAYDALMLNPAVGPGLGIANSQGEVWDAGAAFISLRNLGTNRSLVLVDGMRRVSGSARSSAVDVNMIANDMIDRIEVVTGGAAAIYGADAVTGAVNIIMKKDITGLHLSATNGISQQGDANEYSVSLATGARFAGGRGSFVIGGTYTRTTPIKWTDRYTNRAFSVPNPASRNASDGIPDSILDEDYRNMYRSQYPVYYYDNRFYYLRNGDLNPVSYSWVHSAGELGSGQGGVGATNYENHLLRDALRTAVLTARLGYELSSAITWNAHFDYGHSHAAAATVFPEIRDDSRAFWWGNTGGEVATLDNPFLPDSLRRFMIANGLTRLAQDRTYFNFPQPLEIHRRDTFTIGTDVGGKLTDTLNWLAFFQYGQVVDHVDTINMGKLNAWRFARDVIADPATGQPECRDPAARAAGCVPLNMFSTDPASDALVDYVLGSRHEWRKNTQYIAGGTISGDPFRLPYGDVSIALGAEWRRERLSTRDDPDPANLADLVYSGVDYTLHPALDAARETSELYGELVVPLLKGLRFARRLQIEGAYRFSRYSDNNPDTNTWKVGAVWEPFAGLTLRAVRSRSVRVPNFGELYAPVVRQQLGIVADPCIAENVIQGPNRPRNCAALGVAGLITADRYPDGPLVVTGGNPDLMPETSNSLTLGAVFQPRFLPGFDLTVDYWDIRIANVITQFAYITIMNLCVDSPSTNNVFCGLQTRDPVSGHVHEVNSFNVNAAKMIARGIDFGASYRRRAGPGQLRLTFQGSYLIEQMAQATPGVDSGNAYFAGQWNYPRFRGTLMAGYDLGKVSFGLNTRFISSGNLSNTDPTPETRDPRRVPAHVYNDLTVQFRPGGKDRLTLGVKNIGNVGIFAPLQDSGGAQYDQVGRYFFARVDVQF